MLATSSQTGAIATVPLLPITTKTCPLTIKFPSNPNSLTIALPSCYDEAIKTAKHCYDWFLDPEVAETSTDQNLPQVRSLIEKKATQTPFIRGLTWSIDGQYLAVALESFTFLLYSITNNNTEIKSELITVIGFPRHLGQITMTPNGKNWIIIDVLGDIYAFSHAKILAGDQTQTQQQLYSVGTLCPHFFSLQHDNKDYLLTADSEAKIRISNLPAFFDIKSFCMGSQASPTAVIQLKSTTTDNQITNSPFIISTSPTGYVRERIHDRSSAFRAYIPTETSIMIHNFTNGEFALQPYKIDNASDTLPFIQKDLTQFSAVVYYGLGAIYQASFSTPTRSVTNLYTVPTLSTCDLDRNGHLNPNAPLNTRSGLDQLLAITVDVTTPVDETQSTTTTTVTRGIKVDNVPEWFDFKKDLIHQIESTTDQTKFIIQTITNKVLIVTQPNQNDITSLNVIDSYDFSVDARNGATDLPTSQDYMKYYNTSQYAVSKYINFSWRFERAPNRQVAQKRGHMVDALREAEEDAQGRDPNEVVKLGRDEDEEQA